MPELIALSDIYIERKGPDAKLYCPDGEMLCAFPASWSNIQIETAARFANSAYDKGFTVGEHYAKQRVRSALGIIS